VDVGAGEQSYRGPVKDASTASLWDLQYMANRLAMEGSAHGNAYTQRSVCFVGGCFFFLFRGGGYL
jgi:hypothetical protein